MSEKQDHEVDITEAARAELADLAEYLEAEREEDYDEEGAIDLWALEVDVLKSTTNPNRWRVEITTGVGGPTTRWVVDSRWSNTAEFHHSWGWPTTSVELYGSRVAEIVELARSLAEDY